VFAGLQESAVADLKGELEALRFRVREIETPIHGIMAPEQPGSGNSEGQHADLLGRVSELEQVASGETVDISGDRFNSVADVQAWLRINEVDTSALAWDWFSLLVAAKLKGHTGHIHSSGLGQRLLKMT
jgi:hypothetical protein